MAATWVSSRTSTSDTKADLVLLFRRFEVFALALLAVLAEWLLEALLWWRTATGNRLAAGAMVRFLLRRHHVASRAFLTASE